MSLCGVTTALVQWNCSLNILYNITVTRAQNVKSREKNVMFDPTLRYEQNFNKHRKRCLMFPSTLACKVEGLSFAVQGDICAEFDSRILFYIQVYLCSLKIQF